MVDQVAGVQVVVNQVSGVQVVVNQVSGTRVADHRQCSLHVDVTCLVNEDTSLVVTPYINLICDELFVEVATTNDATSRLRPPKTVSADLYRPTGLRVA